MANVREGHVVRVVETSMADLKPYVGLEGRVVEVGPAPHESFGRNVNVLFQGMGQVVAFYDDEVDIVGDAAQGWGDQVDLARAELSSAENLLKLALATGNKLRVDEARERILEAVSLLDGL